MNQDDLDHSHRLLDAIPDAIPAPKKGPKAYKPVTRAQIRMLDAGQQIAAQTAEEIEPTFMARQLVLATLPHRNPGNAVRSWWRKNGELTLTIPPGDDGDTCIGYPYGVIPRLLLFWIVSEALATGERRLVLGNSLARFMRDIGLDPSNGTGKRSDARRLREQMIRLFRARISFKEILIDGSNRADRWRDMQVAPEGLLWWDDKHPDQATLFGSWIELSPKFFEAICASPVPVNRTAIAALKGSALALDLYSWVCLTAYIATQTGRARFVSWDLLMRQFGADYHEMRNFRLKARAAMRKIKTVYPGLRVGHAQGGIEILPGSATAVPMKSARRKQVDPPAEDTPPEP